MKGYSYALNIDGFMQAKPEPSMCACVNKHTLKSRNVYEFLVWFSKKKFSLFNGKSKLKYGKSRHIKWGGWRKSVKHRKIISFPFEYSTFGLAVGICGATRSFHGSCASRKGRLERSAKGPLAPDLLTYGYQTDKFLRGQSETGAVWGGTDVNVCKNDQFRLLLPFPLCQCSYVSFLCFFPFCLHVSRCRACVRAAHCVYDSELHKQTSDSTGELEGRPLSLPFGKN